jgi:hypothetical protein
MSLGSSRLHPASVYFANCSLLDVAALDDTLCSVAGSAGELSWEGAAELGQHQIDRLGRDSLADHCPVSDASSLRSFILPDRAHNKVAFMIGGQSSWMPLSPGA